MEKIGAATELKTIFSVLTNTLKISRLLDSKFFRKKYEITEIQVDTY